MARFQAPDTAFAASRGQKRPKKDDEGHLAFIRTLPCLIGNGSCTGKIHAHHIRPGDLRYGKRDLGKERPDDCWTVPLCAQHHQSLHDMGETLFWSNKRLNPYIIALSLHANTGDDILAREILRRVHEPL